MTQIRGLSDELEAGSITEKEHALAEEDLLEKLVEAHGAGNLAGPL